MGVERRRAEGCGVNLTVLSGAIPADEILSYFAAIDPAEPANAGDWITYDRGDADISELNAETTGRLKALLAEKTRALAALRPIRSALVSGKALNQPYFQFWRLLVATDPEHPSEPGFFASLDSAMDWLGLDAEGRAEVQAQLDATPASSLSSSA